MNLTAPCRKGPAEWVDTIDTSREMVSVWDIGPYKFVFLRLKLLFRITEFLDFVHHPEF
jgi:hypothetical protein